MYRKYISIIITKRCNAKCLMCDCHAHPSDPSEEIGIEELNKLPKVRNITVTGGEPFIRTDLDELVGVLEKKAKRILINTNGYYTDRMMEFCRKHPKVGIRISIDGFQKTHDHIRGIPIYDRAMSSLDAVNRIRGGGVGIWESALRRRILIIKRCCL